MFCFLSSYFLLLLLLDHLVFELSERLLSKVYQLLEPRLNLRRSSATAKSTARSSCLVGVIYDISRQKIC